MAILGVQGCEVHLVAKVTEGRQVSRAQLDRRVRLDHMAGMEHVVNMVKRVWRAILVALESLDTQVHKETTVKGVRRDQQGPEAPTAWLVYLAHRARMRWLALQDKLDIQVSLVTQALLDLVGKMAKKEQEGSLDMQAQQAQKAILAILAKRANQAQKDLLDLLVSQVLMGIRALLALQVLLAMPVLQDPLAQ